MFQYSALFLIIYLIFSYFSFPTLVSLKSVRVVQQNFKFVYTFQGYQLMKDGKKYGPVMSPDTHNVRVKGLKLGDKVDLEIQTLTNRDHGSCSHI